MAKLANAPQDSLVAFIDILGFSNRVKTVKEEADLESVISDIEIIQYEFEHRPQDHKKEDIHAWYKKEVLAFSDCVVVSLPFTSKAAQSQGTFDALLGEMTSFAFAQGTCVLEKNLFLRGAIDKGLWYRDEDTMVSPALARAYELEYEANMPVITLSDEVYSYFGNHPDRNYYSEDFDPFPNMFRKYDETKSGNAAYFIDYLHICAESLDWRTDKQQYLDYKEAGPDERYKIQNEGYRENARRWFTRHKDLIESAYNKSDEVDVKEKYKWLMGYHNDVVSNYGLDDDYLASTKSTCLQK